MPHLKRFIVVLCNLIDKRSLVVAECKTKGMAIRQLVDLAHRNNYIVLTNQPEALSSHICEDEDGTHRAFILELYEQDKTSIRH